MYRVEPLVTKVKRLESELNEFKQRFQELEDKFIFEDVPDTSWTPKTEVSPPKETSVAVAMPMIAGAVIGLLGAFGTYAFDPSPRVAHSDHYRILEVQDEYHQLPTMQYDGPTDYVYPLEELVLDNSCGYNCGIPYVHPQMVCSDSDCFFEPNQVDLIGG